MVNRPPHEVAYQIINDAIFDKSSHLDLSNLGLRNLDLSQIPAIIRQTASSLRSIDLSQNELINFPIDELLNLEGLESIDISHNNIQDLPGDIRIFKSLKSLNLENNSLSSLPYEIEYLVDLTILNIDRNNFSRLPPEVTALKSLEILSARGNQLEDILPESDGVLTIKSLNVADNKLKNISTSIKSFSRLESLDASHNQIAALSEELGYITSLTNVDLSGNNISTLPRSIRQLKKLRNLYLLGNPISTSIPLEILSKHKNPGAIIEYYFSTLNAPLGECKILVVGQGSVGKTSLINRLASNSNLSETKTDGIAISKSKIENYKNASQPITLNIWDFGGQEIMHATHQFFLTKRSLYLLVLDARLTQEENRVEYWLKIIRAFGGESPILIVGNKVDQHPLDISRTELSEKYPKVMDFVETSAKDGTGIDLLKNVITEQVNSLPQVHDLLPKTWFTVKAMLEARSRNESFIAEEEYVNLCRKNGVDDKESQVGLIGFLHDLGIVLHFQDDPRLEALGILNPEWVTNGVYKILNSPALFQNQGILTVSMLDEILNTPEYPRGKRLFIMDLMKKFELCYALESDKSDTTFLIPDLLPKDEPVSLQFNGITAFEYVYPVLLSSIITRFIVRMEKKIVNEINNNGKPLLWRTGVKLKIGENYALVKVDTEDRKITISIDGPEYTRRDALSAIRYELDEIHGSIKGLDAEKYVPIPNAESQKYEFLLKLERDGVKTLPVPGKIGNEPILIDISKILSGIEGEASRREEVGRFVNNNYINYIEGNLNTGGGDFSGGNKNTSASSGGIIIGKDVAGNIVSGNDNEIIQDSYKKIYSSNIDSEIKETLQELIAAIEVMNTSLTTPQSVEITEDLVRLVEEVSKPNPNKKWYSVSIDGLICVAEKLDKLGDPVIGLSRKLLSILTSGIIN